MWAIFVYCIGSQQKWCSRWNRSSWGTKKELFIVCNLCDGCWCAGDIRSQGISSHSIDPVLLEYSSLNTTAPGIILCMRQANERRGYNVTSSLIGWAYSQNDPCCTSRDNKTIDAQLTIIGSDNGLSPDRRQAIIWTNDGLLLIGPLGTNFSEILIEILTFSFKKMCLKVLSAKRRPFCLGLNVLNLVSCPGLRRQPTNSADVILERHEVDIDFFIHGASTLLKLIQVCKWTLCLGLCWWVKLIRDYRQDPGYNSSLVPNNKNAHKGMFRHSATRARGHVPKMLYMLV